MTYGDWLRTQPAAVQDEVLGKGKAALFRAGKIGARDLVDQTLRPLRLTELERLASGRAA